MKAKIEIRDHVFDNLKEIANSHGKSAYEFINEIIELSHAHLMGLKGAKEYNESGNKLSKD